jgi:ligand-binding sensor domain-containing protein
MIQTPRGASTTAAIAAVVASLLVVWAEPAHGVARLMRRYGGADGLSAPVHALAQDSRGFIWLGSEGGVTRYDGREFRRWASDLVSNGVTYLATNPRGEVFGVTEAGTLFEITDRGARFVEESPNVPLAGVRHLDFAKDGTLWLVVNGGLRG